MRIVNPTFGRLESVPEQSSGRRVDWLHDPMCVFSNSKPNADELLTGLSVHLRGALERDEVAFEAKRNASMPADRDMLDWLAQQYRLAVLAIGD